MPLAPEAAQFCPPPQAELMRQREDSLAQQSVQHAAEVSELSTTCEVLRAQLQAMHASVGAMASRPASPLCNESTNLSTSKLLMCEHVAVAALRGEVAAAEHAAQETQRRHAVERAVETAARETQHQQLLAMHQAASALGTVAAAQQQSREDEAAVALRNEMARMAGEAEVQQRAAAAALAAEQTRGLALQWARDRAEERTRDIDNELGAARTAAQAAERDAASRLQLLGEELARAEAAAAAASASAAVGTATTAAASTATAATLLSPGTVPPVAMGSLDPAIATTDTATSPFTAAATDAAPATASDPNGTPQRSTPRPHLLQRSDTYMHVSEVTSLRTELQEALVGEQVRLEL